MNWIDDVSIEYTQVNDSFPKAVPTTGLWLNDYVEAWNFHLLRII